MPKKSKKDSPRGWYEDLRQKMIKWSGIDKPSDKPDAAPPEYKSAWQSRKDQGGPGLSSADIGSTTAS